MATKITPEIYMNELTLIKKKVTSFVHKAKNGCNVGTIDFFGFDRLRPMNFEIHVENDGKLGRDIVSIIIASKYVQHTSFENIVGHYDWASDKYIRPYSVITFTMQ